MVQRAGNPVNLNRSLQLAILLLLLYSCTSKTTGINKEFHFSLLKESETNISFNNKITESDSVNFLTDQYLYMGAGVGIADFNNDGLPDIFFAGEQVSCKLYLNKGNLKFEDVTKQAGLVTNKWCTGVSVVDINNDGRMDIYVSVSHSGTQDLRKNMLFINHDGLVFTEEAADYGLDNSGFSAQAAFFDYDKDGDLDMYLANHNIFKNQPHHIVSYNTPGVPVAADKLFRNEGIPPGKNHPVFKDVSAEAGIRDDGYGIGLAISDLDNDGWPDIYVSNDFSGFDLLWMNNKNGSFTNRINSCLHHQGYNSKGLDVADMNNDQLPDIAVADMQPETNDRKKLMYTGLNPELYDRGQKISNDQPQLSRNMLQLNNGNRISDSITEPFFSEIGQLSGISETDWSWSVLMADFDNDGWKDMQFTNGISKDLINNDFLSHRNEQEEGELAEIKKGSPGNLASLKDLDDYGNIKISNYYYHNNGGLNFTDATVSAGMAIPAVSQGAAYADLDNDGDLDVVMSNMNQEAFIWKNEWRNTVKDSVHNFLSVKLKGSEQNISGIGAKVYLYAGGRTQFLEQNATKGYLSSVIDRLHFGLGNVLKIDSIKIIWPDDKVQWIKQVGINQNTTINYPDAAETELYRESHQAALMTDVAGELNLTFRHEEVSFFDFGDQKMLPQKYSQPGPPLITGDVNKDGLADFFVGGGSYQSGVIFIQNKDGSFKSAKPEQKDKQGEDAGAVFFDADGDKDIDLLVMEGSTEFGNSTTLNIPRLYKNDGNGNFAWDSAAFSPGITTISQAVTVGDYDNDGDEDIFIGGRILANRYPLSPRSYILQNNKGKFTDVTKDVCTALEKPGLVTGAIWTDFDNDKSIDLVICGEWMPVRFFKNTNGKLNEVTAVTGLKNMNGLWRSLTAVDIDKDGDMDFVAGNLGLNNKFHVSPGRPYSLYAGDIDGNGLMDLIPAYYIKNKEGAYDLFPGLDRSQFADEVLAVKKRYPLNKDFASITMKELMDGNGLKNMLAFTCETMASTWIENTGNGHFIAHLLPLSAQFAPINSILATDIDKDGYTDLVLGGNEYQAEAGTGRYDASYGQILTNNGKGGFTSLTPVQSGFIVDGDTKNLITLTGKNKERLILAAVNNDRLRCFKINAVAGKNK